MHLDPGVVDDLTFSVRPDRWLRIMPARHMATPLGRGFGASRWSSPTRRFKVIYLGQEVGTSLAETVVRDRFEAVPREQRMLNLSELTDWAIAEVRATAPLKLLDLTGAGPFRLGIDTDAVGAKAHAAGQEFSDALHADFPSLAGIMYLSRLTRGRCMAVYESSIDRRLEAGPAIGLERLPGLGAILDELSITMNDDLA